ncbi:MAG: ABC transporter permease [Firmicutes bacterium]|nr:ABC transporter permease [Bacillota bacterium]
MIARIAVNQQPGNVPRTARKRSQWLLAWDRYKQNKVAVAGLVWVVIFFIFGVIGPWVAPSSYATTNYLMANHPPTWAYPMGTDSLGHNMLSEMLFSVRYALEIAVFASLAAFLLGTILGLWAGLKGGLADTILMRVVDFFFAFPAYFLDLILVTKFGRGLGPMIFALAVTGWAGYARLIRGLVLGMRNGEMVEAANALGASPLHLARKYVFPNVVSNMIIALAFGIPSDLTVQAALSVVGMGLNPPLPSFGNMIAAAGSNVLGYPWLMYWPAGIFAITLLSFLFVADGLQEALNPKGGS